MKFAIFIVIFAIALWAMMHDTFTPEVHHRVPEQRCPYPDWSLEHMGVDKSTLSCYGTTRAEWMRHDPPRSPARRST